MGANNLVLGNRISTVTFGVRWVDLANGKYRDNITVTVITPYFGDTDAGNND